MWTWLTIMIVVFIVLVFLEELIEFLVNRIVLGPAPWEGKLKSFFDRVIEWFKRKVKRHPSVD
ncbi:hypothetical protein ABE096_04685 [Robertmurraya massiliosenegalensis]|uniref:hypothetical protein n=1 Tax=Robertmurraya massiliosenegalensis TaxID=1287657 RepID=UPI003D26E122